MHDILHSEAFWTAVGALAILLEQVICTRFASRLDTNSPWKRVIRFAHGLLNKIDPKGNDK